MCGFVVAAISMLFYGTLVNLASTEVAAGFIATTSLAAMIQIACLPQAWIYVYRQPSKSIITSSNLVEITGICLGLGFATAISNFTDNGVALVYAYLALAMAGSTVSLGYLRGKRFWALFATSTLLPSFTRLAIALFLVSTKPGKIESLTSIILVFLLIPEGIRYLTFSIPVIALNWTPTTVAEVTDTWKKVFHNWLYDIGSATTEVADKYLISLIVSPQLLVVYFFARKITSVITISIEPIYALKYRKLCETPEINRRSQMRKRILTDGYAASTALCTAVIILMGIYGAFLTDIFKLIPDLVFKNFSIFCAFLIADSAIAANRWGRYLTLLDGSSAKLLKFRCLAFLIFIASTYTLSTYSETIALSGCFAAYALLEYIYVHRSAGNARPIW